jgi:ribonuclease HI
MKSISLFTDVSAHPKLRLGVGAFLALPSSFTGLSADPIQSSSISDNIRAKRFEVGASTTLELLTALWAIEECRSDPQPCRISLYSDSQCIAGLIQRRRRLEAKGFLSNNTGQPLANAGLYRRFYALHDELAFEVIKVPGHTLSGSHTAVQRIFSFVDRKAREELRHLVAERKMKDPR